jgi:hypothetical protein
LPELKIEYGKTFTGFEKDGGAAFAELEKEGGAAFLIIGTVNRQER